MNAFIAFNAFIGERVHACSRHKLSEDQFCANNGTFYGKYLLLDDDGDDSYCPLDQF
jgi:hypothetical protein